MSDFSAIPPASSSPPTVIKSPYPEPSVFPEINAHDFFFNRPDQASWTDFTFLIDAGTGKKTMYKEYVEWVKDVATALGTDVDKGGLGLSGDPAKKEMIGILSENSVEYLVLIHALLAVATPFSLFSSYSTHFELKHCLGLSNITHLFSDAKFLPLAVKVAKEVGLPSNRIYVLQGRAHNYGQGHRKSLSDFRQSAMNGKMQRLCVRAAKRDTLAYLVFSSGTSGLPKAVMISHGNIIYATLQAGVVSKTVAEVYTPPTPPTPEGIPVSLAFLPIYHTYGLHVYAFRSLLQPVTLIMVKRWEIKSALRYIAKYRVTTIPLVPSIAHQLVNYPNIKKADLSSISLVGSGGAYLPRDLAEKMSSLLPKTARVADGFGMSEVDTLKISGIQVSPAEIENVLMAHPEKLLTDCSVAGVSGGRTSDEKVPRAWIVLSAEGKKLGAKETIARLDEWHQTNLSKYKWLRGGYEVLNEVPKSITGKVLRRVLQGEYEKRASRKSQSKL